MVGMGDMDTPRPVKVPLDIAGHLEVWNICSIVHCCDREPRDICIEILRRVSKENALVVPLKLNRHIRVFNLCYRTTYGTGNNFRSVFMSSCCQSN